MRKDLSPAVLDTLIDETMNAWFHSTAQMMTSIAVGSALEVWDEEEAKDLLERLSAIATQVGRAFEWKPTVGFDVFIDKLIQLHKASIVTIHADLAKHTKTVT